MPIKDLAISYPVLVDPGVISPEIVENPLEVTATLPTPGPGRGGDPAAKLGAAKTPSRPSVTGPPVATAKGIRLMKFPFVVEFVWQPLSPAEREQRKKAAETAKPAATPPGTPAGASKSAKKTP